MQHTAIVHRCDFMKELLDSLKKSNQTKWRNGENEISKSNVVINTLEFFQDATGNYIFIIRVLPLFLNKTFLG